MCSRHLWGSRTHLEAVIGQLVECDFKIEVGRLFNTALILDPSLSQVDRNGHRLCAPQTSILNTTNWAVHVPNCACGDWEGLWLVQPVVYTSFGETEDFKLTSRFCTSDRDPFFCMLGQLHVLMVQAANSTCSPVLMRIELPSFSRNSCQSRCTAVCASPSVLLRL